MTKKQEVAQGVSELILPNPDKAHNSMVEVLTFAFGETFKWDDSVGQTADRFIRYLQEYEPKPIPFKPTTFIERDATGMIQVGPIAIASICSHHMLPFYGHAWVGYIPSNGRIIGLSKIPRLVKWMATTPTNQERLTKKVAKWLDETLEPKGVMVVIKSTHTCMSCRGVRETDAKMVTSLPLGVFGAVESARAEFLHFVEV